MLASKLKKQTANQHKGFMGQHKGTSLQLAGETDFICNGCFTHGKKATLNGTSKQDPFAGVTGIVESKFTLCFERECHL